MNYFCRALISEDGAFFDPRVSRCRLVAFNGQPWRASEKQPTDEYPGPSQILIAPDVNYEMGLIITALTTVKRPVRVGFAWTHTKRDFPALHDPVAVMMLNRPGMNGLSHCATIIEDNALGVVVDKALPCIFCCDLFALTPIEIYPISFESFMCMTCRKKLIDLRANAKKEPIDISACSFCRRPFEPESAFTLAAPLKLQFQVNRCYYLHAVVHEVCAQTMGLAVRRVKDDEKAQFIETSNQQRLELNTPYFTALGQGCEFECIPDSAYFVTLPKP